MPNPITGDFEAVVQISGGTVNRLLAAMHQNAFANPKAPSFPHSIRIRIGDGRAIDGVRGLAHCQIGAPRVELMHGATDRFILEVDVRAWFRGDAGSASFPAFVHGTVRAEYRIEHIDPRCFGWANIAHTHLWIRVVEDSVRFQGTTSDDQGALQGVVTIPGTGSPTADDAAKVALVQKQIAGLLAHHFEATPHPLEPGFRRDVIRSLNAAIGGSAIAVALGLSGEPSGQIASVNNPILEGADIGFGIAIEYLLSLTRPFLDTIARLELSVPVHKDLPLKDFDTVYRVRLDAPTIEWTPKGASGVVSVKVHGTAKTSSIAADADFDVVQRIVLAFDAATGTIVARGEPPFVTASSSGLYHGTVKAKTEQEVAAAVAAMTIKALAQIQPILAAIPTRAAPLVDQLRSLDPQAAIQFTEGLFLRDGIILRGVVGLSPRRRPVVQHERLPTEDGHTALESWIPGGRIDRFEWSWTWTASSAKGGKAARDDRFVLRRPRGRTSRWGTDEGVETPIPGLDGWGSLCLRIIGVQVDAITGDLVPVDSVRRCKRFGLNISADLTDKERLFLHDLPELSKDVPFRRLARVRVGDAHVASDAANTLVMFAGRRWDEDTASAMKQGLEHCGRYDAGLALIILFPEGVLEHGGSRLIDDVEAFARRVGIPAIVNEDVNGGWSRTFRGQRTDQEIGWVLINPRGAITWQHDGRATADMLTAALDRHLQRSRGVSAAPVRSGVEVGSRTFRTALYADLLQSMGSDCPPIPFERGATVDELVVTFVQRHAFPSRAHLRQLIADGGQRAEKTRRTVAVIEGADAREAEALKDELGAEFVIIADSTGTIADRCGIGMWPTTVTVDQTGTVSDVQTGFQSGLTNPGESAALE